MCVFVYECLYIIVCLFVSFFVYVCFILCNCVIVQFCDFMCTYVTGIVCDKFCVFRLLCYSDFNSICIFIVLHFARMSSSVYLCICVYIISSVQFLCMCQCVYVYMRVCSRTLLCIIVCYCV